MRGNYISEETKNKTAERKTLEEIRHGLKENSCGSESQGKEDLLFYRYFKSSRNCIDQDYNFNDLMSGKLSLVKAFLMNDKFDSTLNIDYDTIKEKLYTCFQDEKLAVLASDATTISVRPFAGVQPYEFNDIIESIINPDKGDDEKKDEFIKKLKEECNKECFLKKYWGLFKQDCKNYDSKITERVDRAIKILKNTPKKTYLRSFSETYDNNAMWAHYAGNEGYCVRYNFEKLRELSKADSENLGLDNLVFRQVNYSKKRISPKYDATKMIKALLYYNSKPDDLDECLKEYEEQIANKDISWESEKEWRLIYSNRDKFDGFAYSLNFDLADAVYIDESVLNCEKTKAIITKAKNKGWKIFVRKFSPKESDYLYEDYALPNLTPDCGC